jgi:ABC-type lipoprotein export system ATPase subunit
MSRMCSEKDFTIVIVTHDERFMEFADKTYLINDGFVSVIEKEETSLEEEMIQNATKPKR